MKILIVDCTETFGGAFELALTLARFLTNIPGVEPVLVSGQPREVLAERAPQGVRWYQVQSGTSDALMHLEKWPDKLGVLYKLVLHEIPAAIRLSLIARRERADVIHLNNMLNSQIYGVVAAWFNRVACICCHRDYEHDSAFIRFVERRVTAHVVCSKLIERDVLNLGVPPQKLEFIWDGVDVAQFGPHVPAADLTTIFGVPAGRKIFAIFGRLVEWKGQRVFLEAAARVCAKIPEAHALIVGGHSDGDPAYVDELHARARELGIAERVTFTGFRSDVAELMRACRVLVHASLLPEPFGTAILEGMACGVPYVAMNQGGPTEMVEEGNSGFLVPPGDATAMASGIETLLSDDRRCAQMGAAARSRVLRHFAAEVFAQRHYELYQRCSQP